MAKVIAICNHKGGVGKTTSVASIGTYLSQMNKRTLLVDLDAQANLTTSLLPDEPEETVYNSLKEEKPLPILEVKENLSIVPSSLDMAGVELELANRMSREYLLKDLLEPIAANYDYILLDCPPSLGIITLNALVAATELYIPLTAEALPSKGITKLTDILQSVKKRLNPTIEVAGVIITRWKKTKLSQMVEEALRQRYGKAVFTTKIRENVSIAEAPLSSQSIAAYAPESNGAKDYRALTEEIIERTSGDSSLYFCKYYDRDNSYTIGKLIGEPNEVGEQDYIGYSVSSSSLYYTRKEDKDFLTEYEVEQLQSGSSHGSDLQRIGLYKYSLLEALFAEAKEKLSSVGYTPKDSYYITLEEIEDAPEAKEIAEDYIERAYKIAKS